MPTNNVDLVDQHCRDISGWAVTQRSRFDYMYHCYYIFDTSLSDKNERKLNLVVISSIIIGTIESNTFQVRIL